MVENFRNLHFPTLCIDGFFDDPDSIREFALNSAFIHTGDGAWPGKRTEFLHEISPALFDIFCNKLFSVFFNIEREAVGWQVSAHFQLIEPFNGDPCHIKNTGWIHRDSDYLYAGVVYLTPGINPDTGTSIFQAIDDYNFTTEEEIVKKTFYKDGVDVNDTYDALLEKNNNKFKETIRFKNIYNRLIGWEGHTPHGVNTFYTAGPPRLTLVYFVTRVGCDSTPLQRLIR